MEEATIPGLPAEYAGVVTVAVGLLSGLLVSPLTAIAKKLGRSSGPTTVTISAVLSLIVGLGYSLYSSAVSGQIHGVQGLLIALIAFLKANGDYLTRVSANAKANRESPPVVTQPVVVREGPLAGAPLPPEAFGPSFRDVPSSDVGPTPEPHATLRVED